MVVAEEQRGANINACRSSGYCRVGSNCEEWDDAQGREVLWLCRPPAGKATCNRFDLAFKPREVSPGVSRTDTVNVRYWGAGSGALSVPEVI
jgi:hypothetical protein